MTSLEESKVSMTECESGERGGYQTLHGLPMPGVPDGRSITTSSAEVGRGEVEVASIDPELRNLRFVDIFFAENERGVPCTC